MRCNLIIELKACRNAYFVLIFEIIVNDIYIFSVSLMSAVGATTTRHFNKGYVCTYCRDHKIDGHIGHNCSFLC